MLSKHFPALGLLLCAGACGAPAPVLPADSRGAGASAALAPVLPTDARANLDPRWVQSPSPGIRYRWPPADGFAAPPTPVVLPPGMLIDRFGPDTGPDTGNFFSPRGARFDKRSLPYDCAVRRYSAFRIKQPLLVWIGKAAPWFSQDGGATQIQTDAPVSLLIQDGVIETAPLTRLPCS